jgi:hypothetical protein
MISEAKEDLNKIIRLIPKIAIMIPSNFLLILIYPSRRKEHGLRKKVQGTRKKFKDKRHRNHPPPSLRDTPPGMCRTNAPAGDIKGALFDISPFLQNFGPAVSG